MHRRSLIAAGAAGAFAAVLPARASVVDKFEGGSRPMDTMEHVAGWMPGKTEILELKGRRIGEGRPKMIAPTTSKTVDEFTATVGKLAKLPSIDVIEERIDYLGDLTPKAFAEVTVKGYQAAGDKIALVTLRNGTDGGPSVVDDQRYGEIYREVIANGRADIIDLELFRDASMIAELVDAAHKKGIKVILSDHEFKFMPDEEELIRRLLLEEKAGADILKLAVMAFSPEDALTLMSATAKVRHYHSSKPMLTMAMGKWGVLTRITGEGFGSDLTFVSIGGKASAPGQIPAEDCLQVLETLHKAMNP